MKPSTANDGGELVEDDEVEVDVDVDVDDDEMVEEVVEDDGDDDEEMEEVVVDSSTEVEEEEEDDDEDETEVEVDESEVFSDEGTTTTGPAQGEDQENRPSINEKVQEFEDWLWDSRRQPRSDSATAQSLTSADVYTTSAATGQGDEEGGRTVDDDAFPTSTSSTSFFAPTGAFGEGNGDTNRESGGGDSQPYYYNPTVSTTTSVGAVASEELGGDDSVPYYHDDGDDGMTRDDDNTDASTLLAVAQSPSDRFEDEPDSLAAQQGLKKRAAGGAGTAAAAAGAGAAAAATDDDDDENRKPLRALGGLPLVDKVLIGLIVIVILILITVLPITLTRNTSRDVLPIVPTRAPTRLPSSPTLIPTAPPTTSQLRQYEVVGGPFVAAPNSNLGAAVAALFGLNASTSERLVLAGAPNASSGQGAVLVFAEQVAEVTRRKSRHRRASTKVVEVTVGTQKGPTGLRLRNPSLQVRNAQAAASQSGPWLNQSGLLLQQNGTVGFGSALFAAGSSMVVGSPESANGGSAYVFQYVEGSDGAASWTTLGPALVGPTSPGNGTSGGSARFGSAVAVASTSGGAVILAVGAPQYEQGDGAVYTYFYESSSNAWQPLSTSTFPITTFGSSEQLGNALDMSRDGEHLVVGAPNANGGMGRFVAYQWNVAGSEWLQVFEQVGTMSAGLLGSSVAFMSGQREFVVVGAPGTLGGNGLVQLYQKSEGSLGYEQLGSDVTGQSAERLGSAGTIAGGVDENPTALVLLLGTATGLVRRLDFDLKNNVWTTAFAAIDTGLSAPITALSSDEGSGTVVVGISSESTAVIYAESAVPASRSPTVAPVTPAPTSQTPISSLPPSTIAPTASNSTAAPTSAPQPQWMQTAGPLPGSTSSFGGDVAIVKSFVAVGDPGSGSVYTYTRLNQEWIDLEQVSGSTQSGSLFGTSVVFNPSDNSLVVGAPGVYASNTQTPVGATYYYTLSGSVWTQQGGPITGDSDIFAANEGFGLSVAVSRSGVVAVGAPQSNVGNVVGRGRVYTFAYNATSSSWVRRGGNGTGPVGAVEGGQLGSAVALSPDGSTLVAGAPGGASGAGSFSIYSWNGSAWSPAFSRRGNSTTERLGTSVAVLSYDGGFVAVGGPGYGGGSGVIRVYQRQQQGFAPYGVPLVGEGGDALGELSSLSGSIDSSGIPTILAGSSSGAIKTLRYNAETKAWNETLEMVTTSIGNNPSLGGSTSLGLMVAGRDGVANIYALS